VGDERAAPGSDIASRTPGTKPATGELNGPDGGFLFTTPAGVLAAQRLVGNEAVEALLSTADPMESIFGGSETEVARRGSGTARVPVPVSRDVADGQGQGAEPLTGGAGTVTYKYSKSPTQGGSFQFTDPDFNTLLATLTARMGKEEIGRTLPSVTLVLNGTTIPQDGSSVSIPDDTAPIKTGTFTVVDNITLPTWTNVGAATVQDAQRTEWNRYAAAVAVHEDLHAADDKTTYDPVGAALGQKPIGAAIDAVSAATTAANALSGPRDQSNPPPTLNPAGTTKVP
jgi:hypothetical protein